MLRVISLLFHLHNAVFAKIYTEFKVMTACCPPTQPFETNVRVFEQTKSELQL